MKAVLVALLAAVLLQTSALAAPDCGVRPAWCQNGYTCEPSACTARSTIALEELTAQLVSARAAAPRLFRPFLEGGLTWSALHEKYGAWGAAGVQLWRLQGAVEVTDQDVRVRAGFRREW